jgi:hypothetical protein
MQNCTVCAHSEREVIDQKLAKKTPLRQLAAQYGLGCMALHRHAHHGSKSAEKVSAKLKPRQARFVREAAKGQTIEQAMIKAGYAPSTAKQGLAGVSQSKEIQELLRSEINRQIPVSKLVDRIAEGLDAKEFKFFASDGHIVDKVAVPDYKERREYIALAAKFGRYFEEKIPQSAATEVDLRPVEELIAEARELSEQLERLEQTRADAGAAEQIIEVEPAD